MNTAQKRTKFQKEYPLSFEFVYKAIDLGDYRYIDRLCNSSYLRSYAVEYLVTLLCDELVSLTDGNKSED